MKGETLVQVLGGIGVAVAALINLLSFFTGRHDKGRETTAQRVAREADERKDDLDRYDERMERLMAQLEQKVATLESKIATLEERNTTLIAENLNHLAEKMRMKNTMDRQAGTITDLMKRVAYLERHEAADDKPGEPGRDGRAGGDHRRPDQPETRCHHRRGLAMGWRLLLIIARDRWRVFRRSPRERWKS